MTDAQRIQQVFQDLEPVMDERMRRLLGAALARAFGYGGVTRVATATGVARSTLHRGLAELAQPPPTPAPPQRTRRPGGGRKRLTKAGPHAAGSVGSPGRTDDPRRSAVVLRAGPA